MLINVAVFCILMLIPRILSVVSPRKMTVGYHFILADKIALVTGLEKLIKLPDPTPEGIEVIRDIEYKNVNGKSFRLDIYKARDSIKPAPLLVFVHGTSDDLVPVSQSVELKKKLDLIGIGFHSTVLVKGYINLTSA
jgi:hypothetical protein